MAKVQLRARSLIILTKKPGTPGDKAKGIAPKAPEVVEVKPGTLFMVDEAHVDMYTKGVKPAAVKVKADKPEGPVDVKEAVKKTRKATGTSRKTKATETDEGSGGEGEGGDGDGGDDSSNMV